MGRKLDLGIYVGKVRYLGNYLVQLDRVVVEGEARRIQIWW